MAKSEKEQLNRKYSVPLRSGYTTGTCAALAAKASAQMALGQKPVDRVSIIVPRGDEISCQVLKAQIENDLSACCAVQKDGGDDIDVTNGILIYARVELRDSSDIEITAGPGIGVVTKPGLSVPVGEAAINPVPRRMIIDAVREELAFFGSNKGALVTVYVPGGEEIAPKTFNPRLGIEGGISIIGTTGIVEPMSERALIDTIYTEINVAKASGCQVLLLVPGNYGEDYVNQTLGLHKIKTVICSNFIGEAIDYGLLSGFDKILLIGHIGKFVKLAAGIFNTHSHIADGRMETLAAHAALAGAKREIIAGLMKCVSTDAAIDILKEEGLLEAVMVSVMEKMEGCLKDRVGRQGAGCQIGALTFSKIHGLLGQTSECSGLLEILKK